jgi:Cu2+-exporting ATPase
LDGVPGVRAARASAVTDCADVWLDPAVDESVVRECISGALQREGYALLPADAQGLQAQQRGERRRMVWQVLVAGLSFSQAMMYTSPLYFSAPGEIPSDLAQLLGWAAWLLSLPALLFCAQPFFRGAWRDLRHRRVGMDVPVALGLGLAFGASTLALAWPNGPWGPLLWLDSLTMFVFFLLLARWLEQSLRHRATQALQAGAQALPQRAVRILPDGQAEDVDASALRPGDTLRVAAGAAFAADGRVLRGHSAVDESALTGEALPQSRGPGEAVHAGSLNLGAPLDVQVLRTGEQSQAAAAQRLLHDALLQRRGGEGLADRIAPHFLAWVLLLAGATAGVWAWLDPAQAVPAALAVLIVTCPCALALAAPTALLCASGALARHGVLLRKADVLERLPDIDTWVFDKTGTLTQAPLRCTGMRPLAGPQVQPAPADAAGRAASLAAHSSHPIAQAIAAAMPMQVAIQWREVKEHPGRGIEGVDATGQRWRLGQAAWAAFAAERHPTETAASTPAPVTGGTVLCCEGRPLAEFDIEESLRPGAAQALQGLDAAGRRLVVLSGDVAERVQRMLQGLSPLAPFAQVRSGQSPAQKLQWVRSAQSQGQTVVMLGDGLNDGPVLAQADVSISFAQASTLAQAQADVLLLQQSLHVLEPLYRHALKTRRVLRQNLAWAMAYNLVAVPLAAAAWMPPWLAGLGMALSSLVVVANAQRLRRIDGLGDPDGPVVASTVCRGRASTSASRSASLSASSGAGVHTGDGGYAVAAEPTHASGRAPHRAATRLA